MEKLLDLFGGITDLLFNVVITSLDTLFGFFSAIGSIGLPTVVVSALLSAFAIRIVMNFM